MALTNTEIGKLVAKEVRTLVATPDCELGAAGKVVQTAREEVPEAILQRFEELLAGKVEQELAKREEVDLLVDYRLDPATPLGRAATEAGLPYQNFPLKFWLKVNSYSVEARVGHNGTLKVIYSTKRYWEERLSENRRDIHFLQETLAGKNPFWWGGPVDEKGKRELQERMEVLQERQKNLETSFSGAKA